MKRTIELKATLYALLTLASANALASVDLEWIGFDAPPSITLFSSVGEATLPGSEASVSAHTEWPVKINSDWLASLPESVEVNLPDRSATELIRDSSQMRGVDSFLWTGRSQECSGVFNAVNGNVLGTISCLNGVYRIVNSPLGARLSRLSSGDSPPGAENDVAIATADPNNPASPDPLPPGPFAPLLVNEPIEVLILYTAAVRQAVGSTNVQQAMQLLIDETQQAMVNSASAQTPSPLANVSLMRAQEISRGESGSLLEDLLYVRNNPESQGLRNYWGADIVMLVRESESQGQCGLAYVPGYGAPLPAGFAELAVGVAVRDCSFSPFNYQHEFGHLLGANHNPQSTANNTPLQPWAFAHWSNPPVVKKDGSRTIVSYKVNSPPLVCRGDCTQVLHYSNAQVNYIGDVVFTTGIAGQRENARVIAEVAPFAAQWRTSLSRIFANGFD